MERNEVSAVEEKKQDQPIRDKAANPERKALQTEVPCSCPGCFSFDF